MIAPGLSADDVSGLASDGSVTSSSEFFRYASIMGGWGADGSRAQSVALARLLLQGLYLKASKNLRVPLKLNMYRNWTFFLLAPTAWAANFDVMSVAAAAAANAAIVKSYAAAVRSWSSHLLEWSEDIVSWFERTACSSGNSLEAPPPRPSAPCTPTLVTLYEPLMPRFPQLPYDATNAAQLQNGGLLLAEGVGGEWIANWKAAIADVMGAGNLASLAACAVPLKPSMNMAVLDELEREGAQCWTRIRALSVDPSSSVAETAAAASTPRSDTGSPAPIALCNGTQALWKEGVLKMASTEPGTASRVEVRRQKEALEACRPLMPSALGPLAGMWRHALVSDGCVGGGAPSEHMSFGAGTKAPSARYTPLSRNPWGSDTGLAQAFVRVSDARTARFSFHPLFPVYDALVSAGVGRSQSHRVRPLPDCLESGGPVVELLSRLGAPGRAGTAATLTRVLSRADDSHVFGGAADNPAVCVATPWLVASLKERVVATGNAGDDCVLRDAISSSLDLLEHLRTVLIAACYELEDVRRRADVALRDGLLLDSHAQLLDPFGPTSAAVLEAVTLTGDGASADVSAMKKAARRSGDALRRRVHGLLHRAGCISPVRWEMLASCIASSCSAGDVAQALTYFPVSCTSRALQTDFIQPDFVKPVTIEIPFAPCRLILYSHSCAHPSP